MIWRSVAGAETAAAAEEEVAGVAVEMVVEVAVTVCTPGTCSSRPACY
jgi:hypothetical protein